MDSRRRQRSIALNLIPPLPIPHGLEYPLVSRMHLVVVHPRLGARRRPFSRSPGSRSRANLRVLGPLTGGPQGQPSPLQTPHGRHRVQGIFPTSPGQVPHGYPTVHHSVATGFPIPPGCCFALSIARFTLFISNRNPATSCSRSPHPSFPLPRVCCSALATPLSRPHHFIPFLIPFLYPTGPPATLWRGPLDPHPSGDCFVLLALGAPISTSLPLLLLHSPAQPRTVTSGASGLPVPRDPLTR